MNKHELVNKMMNMRCDGGIMLEPRLQEYLKKRKFNKDNNITPCIPLDKEYQITNHDKKIIRSFMGGNRNIYNNPHYSKDNVKSSDTKKFFESTTYKNYEKYDKVTPKPERHVQPMNMGMFVPDNGGSYYDVLEPNPEYAVDARDFKYDGSGFDLNTTRFNPRADPRIQQPGKETHNKDTSQYKSVRPQKCESHRVTYNSPKPAQSTNYNLLDNTTKKLLDEYKKQPSRLTESFLPNSNQNDNQRYEDQFDDLLEHDMETERMSSIPEHTKKTYGYRDLSEHYFDYLENEDEFTVNALEPWARGGDVTRMDNKKTMRKTVDRELY